jgi:hypothetical protein
MKATLERCGPLNGWLTVPPLKHLPQMLVVTRPAVCSGAQITSMTVVTLVGRSAGRSCSAAVRRCLPRSYVSVEEDEQVQLSVARLSPMRPRWPVSSCCRRQRTAVTTCLARRKAWNSASPFSEDGRARQHCPASSATVYIRRFPNS